MRYILTFSLLLFWAGDAPAQTPAQVRISQAQAAVGKNPRDAQGYNDLALALARRARETADSSFYDKAEEALKDSFRLAPDNFEGMKIRTWILLGKHEFSPALDLAKTLNRRAPDDVLVYGLLADAHAELGNYKEAEEAVQWMLDLRPGNVPAITRAGYLREHFGDLDGALELMSQAYQRIRPDESEDRAWILSQCAQLKLHAGDAAGAERLAERALKLFPGYHYALAALARARTAQGRHAEAAAALQERAGAAPHPENLFELAEALGRAGKKQQADLLYAEFERKARSEMESADNSNRELILYYVDRGKTAEALKIARAEIARRRDVLTRSAYAWALYASGRVDEARAEIDKALAVGTRDPAVLAHARQIKGESPALQARR
jgi:tetratricopeptide (TPR) repeat protein